MIVQSAPTNAPHFVIVQTDHARASAEFARQFGNDQFATPRPHDLLVHVVAHHDEGWAALDARWLQDPATGLPYNLVKTPLAELVRTGQGSPDVNEAHHPFCGIISSMHTYGLYHGRYGLSDFIFVKVLPGDLLPYVTAMLDGELARQARLKELIAAEWAGDAFLFYHYKLLQFCDTLALYFHTTHADARGEARFLNVPRAPGDDVTLTIRPISATHYALDPWPFAADTLTFTTHGRLMTPQPTAPNLTTIAAATPLTTETVTLTHSSFILHPS